jgi:hypothetical protein
VKNAQSYTGSKEQGVGQMMGIFQKDMPNVVVVVRHAVAICVLIVWNVTSISLTKQKERFNLRERADEKRR